MDFNVKAIKKMSLSRFLKLNPKHTEDQYFKVTGKKPKPKKDDK